MASYNVNITFVDLTCCDHQFKTDFVFNLHRLEMHGGKDQRLSQKSQQVAANPTVQLGDVESNSELGQEDIKTFSVSNCRQCGLKIPPRSLSSHIEIQHTPALLQCPNCDYVNKNKSYIRRHYNLIHNIECNICGNIFKNIKLHLLSTICGKELNHSNVYCVICRDIFRNKSELKTHTRKVHDTAKIQGENQLVPVLNCQYCGKQTSASYMKMHIKYKHFSALLKCSKCEYTNCRKTEVKKHFKNAHTEKANTPCQFCGKVYKHIKVHLKNTMCGKNIDDREKGYCEQCGKVLYNKDALKTHIKQVHDKVKDRQCTQCHYVTYSTFNLRQHVSQVHLGKSLEYENCAHCGKRTTSQVKYLYFKVAVL